jgi:hypothetical protein
MAGDVEKLLRKITELANKSGAIKPSPQALLNLKETLESRVPFELLKPSMSNVMNAGNMLNGLLALAGSIGGIQNMADLSKILGGLGGSNLGQLAQQIQKALQTASGGQGGGSNNSGQSQQDAQTKAAVQALASFLDAEKMIAELGDVGAFIAGLEGS